MIDFSEFINLTIDHKKLLTKENLTKAFKKMDIDNDGKVGIEELKKAFEADGNMKKKSE